MSSVAGPHQMMASPDTPIVVKVSIDDTVRRFKLPLSDVTPSKFSAKLRQLLQVDLSKQLLLERYSDSASSYITLDTNNPPSYKQLYRAAKAKTKLRLKATVKDEPAVQQRGSPVLPEVPALTPLDEVLKSLKLNATPQTMPFGSAWHVCCNNCDKAMLDSHYHCGTCENGDYDLCEACVSRGVTCLVADHWLIKRNIRNGQVINSTTERLTPKPKPVPVSVPAPVPAPTAVLVSGPAPTKPPAAATAPPAPVTFSATIPEKTIPGSFASESKVLPAVPDEANRTCNACVKVLPEKLLVNCSDCDDFDLCIACIKDNSHGHHPGHRFTAIADEKLAASVQALCAPGRGEMHWATCDGCDQRINGVRHKCLDCPDWDLCGKCHSSANSTHPKHRFVPVYDKMSWALPRKAHHQGVFCDGPLCRANKVQSYIHGVRYKCAICHDTDFCANCEAHPSSRHNATHPLIMFKTPVKNASISTLGETGLGQAMPAMGDVPATTATAAPGPVEATRSSPAPISGGQHAGHGKQPLGYGHSCRSPFRLRDTVEVAARKPAPLAKPKQVEGSELDSEFVCDSTADGEVFPPNMEFEQEWTLRNPGPHTWPVGITVRNTGGDNMLNIDPNRPASSTELSAAQSSQATDKAIGPNEQFSFSVKLRSPLSSGNHISYWRARAPDGTPFGHKLWCEIRVDPATSHLDGRPASPLPAPKVPVAAAGPAPTSDRGTALADYQFQLMLLEMQNAKRKLLYKQLDNPQQPQSQLADKEQQQQNTKDEEQLESTSSSQMIFPKLDKESPAASTNLEAKNAPAASHNDLDRVEFDDDSDDETFLTDDEYDILDASDEEVIVDNGVPISKDSTCTGAVSG